MWLRIQCDYIFFLFRGYHNYHYGARCCSKCSAFFRRCKRCGDKLGLEFPRYECISGTNNCTIYYQNYQKCMKCRLWKCLDAGKESKPLIQLLYSYFENFKPEYFPVSCPEFCFICMYIIYIKNVIICSQIAKVLSLSCQRILQWTAMKVLTVKFGQTTYSPHYQLPAIGRGSSRNRFYSPSPPSPPGSHLKSFLFFSLRRLLQRAVHSGG